MEILTIENLQLGHAPAILRLAPDGIAFKIGESKTTLPKEEIKNILLFRGKSAFCLRIASSEQSYDFLNLHESLISKIRAASGQFYGVSPDLTELENFNTIHGNIIYSNATVFLQGEKQIFSIPRAQIQKITELEDELEFHLPDAEIVFSTTSNISQFIENKVAEELCIINGINCINPRSKTTLVFFRDYFVAKGSSYDHSIFYDDVQDLFYLQRDSQYYLVVKLANYIVQGQTKYTSLVFLVTDKETEVVAKGPTLKSVYQGAQSEVLLSVMEALFKRDAQESIHSIKCTSKVFDGHLYLLNSSLQFLPKSISIPLNEISHVEFSRINLSLAQAKTFDMTVFADKVYNFNGIPKESFGTLEVFFTNSSIKIVSEVLDESVSDGGSTEGAYESGSDISDLVDSSEE